MGKGREGRGSFISTEAELQPDFCGIQKEENNNNRREESINIKGGGP